MAQVINFDADSAGAAPPSWTGGVTGRGAHRWTVEVDPNVYIEVDDEHIGGPGRVGVWTKADSVTLFDDFTYEVERK